MSPQVSSLIISAWWGRWAFKENMMKWPLSPAWLKRGGILQLQTFIWKVWTTKLLHLLPGGFSCSGKLLEFPSTALALCPHRVTCVVMLAFSGGPVSREMGTWWSGFYSIPCSFPLFLFWWICDCRVFSSPGKGRAIPWIQLFPSAVLNWSSGAELLWVTPARTLCLIPIKFIPWKF